MTKILPKIYTIAVHKYTPKNFTRRKLLEKEITQEFINENVKLKNFENLDNVPLKNSQAKVTFYTKQSDYPFKVSNVPTTDFRNYLLTKEDENKTEHDWWIVLCFDGRNNVFKNVDKLSARNQDSEYCEKLFEDESLNKLKSNKLKKKFKR